ncbi:MAG: lamin tail domain-containing protein [Verrucomicrobiota bacterium]
MRLLRLSCLLAALAAASSAAGVVLNEIHYHPVERPAFLSDGSPALDLAEDVHEFVELHNPDPQPVSVDGWRLTGGVDFLFPSGTTLVPGGYLVVARHPDRLAAIPGYRLGAHPVLGPWQGVLRNSGDTVRLEDAAGRLVDRVDYSPRSPWPIAADALGAAVEWTGLDPATAQYRGCSLERVSPSAPSNDPANWEASPLPDGPSPGRPNATRQAVPRPVVLVHFARQKRDGSPVLRAGETVRLEAAFSGTNGLGQAALEWHVEDLNATAPKVFRQPLWPVGGTGGGRFAAEVSGPAARSVVRYRILADRGTGLEVVSPRPGDPVRWHAWFMNPARAAGTNEVYDLFISRRSLDRLRTNISANPRRVTSTGASGRLRPSWNATEPATFVHRGQVYDVQMRHHGSQYRREVARRSYKVQFPDYAPFEGRESVFLTDKDYRTEAGHQIFRLAGLPTSETRWVDLYLNADARLVRLQQDEYDGALLERYHAARADPGADPEPPGELYKSQGVLNTDGGAFATSNGEGPYSAGSGIRLLPRLAGTHVSWPSLDRYAATYTLQNHSWRSHHALQALIDGLWLARSNQTRLVATHPRVTNELRRWILARWDTNAFLTHAVLANWMVFWDDTAHNSFLWRRHDGRWSMLPWDFDTTMDGQGAGGSIFDGQPFAGPNYFKQSLTLALREEFRHAAWTLNNTLLHPDHLAAQGVDRRLVTWARTRNPAVNRQLGLTNWTAPLQPVPASPAPGSHLGPTATLTVGAYSHGDSNAPPAHLATRWEIRLAGQSWEKPLVRRLDTQHLLALPLAGLPLPLGAQAFWRASFLDAQGRPSLPSAESGFFFGAPPLPTGVHVSELLAENRGGVRVGGENPDYVELFNPGPEPVPLAGWTLTDDLARPTQFAFPAQAVVPAGGHLLVWCDRRTSPPGLHSGFGLDKDGDLVALFAPEPGGPVSGSPTWSASAPRSPISPLPATPHNRPAGCFPSPRPPPRTNRCPCSASPGWSSTNGSPTRPPATIGWNCSTPPQPRPPLAA